MTKRRPRFYDPKPLIDAIEKLPNPMYDKRHGYYLYVEGMARSNETRVEHIVDYSHELKVRDIKLIPEGITKYFTYRKDPIYKNTYNYYIVRKGDDKGFIKVSIRIDDFDSSKAWIKTIFITYHIK